MHSLETIAHFSTPDIGFKVLDKSLEASKIKFESSYLELLCAKHKGSVILSLEKVKDNWLCPKLKITSEWR